MKVKDFVKLMSDETVYLPIAEHRMDDCLLSKKEKLVSKFGYYEIVRATIDEEGHLILNLKEDNCCPSYRTRIAKRHLSDYEQGVYFGRYGMHKEFVEEEHHYCMSTRGWEACTCGGDKNKCDHCGKEE